MDLFITFDVERDWHRVLGLSNEAYKTKGFSMLEKAIPRLVDIADEYSTPYTFFLCGEVAENVPHLFTGLSNHSIGVHTHPFTHANIFRGNSPNDHEPDIIGNYTFEEQLEMISNDRTLIKDNIGIESNIFRAGKHGANDVTFKVLEKLEFKVDCSVNLGYQLFGWIPFKIRNVDLTEIPTYCDASPETLALANSLFKYSSYVKTISSGCYVVIFHPMVFGNPIIDIDKVFTGYEKFIKNLINWGYRFSPINDSVCKNFGNKRLYNTFGKGITMLNYPMRQIIIKYADFFGKIQ